MNTLLVKLCKQTAPFLCSSTAQLAVLLAIVSPAVRGQVIHESLERTDGTRVDGRIRGDAKTGFRFHSVDASAPLVLDPGSVIHFPGSVANPLAGPPPFRILIGEALRLSGTIQSVSSTSVRAGVSWRNDSLTLPRPGVQAVVQRPGEARVWFDDFETLERSKWTIGGKPVTVEEPHLNGRHSLRLPAVGASLVRSLDEPLAAGRFDLTFFDDGTIASGQQWLIELTFRGPAGPSQVRVILGWSEESFAVQSPSGPTLPVQHLTRAPGWHRFAFRFGPDQTEISVDGKELAHGRGPGGPLTGVRLASSPTGKEAPAKGLAGHIDDLQLIRFAEPPASLEIDITQDEARLVVGDQLYGEIEQADIERVQIKVDGKPISLTWSEVAGLYFRREPAQGVPIEGLLVRVEWRSAPGDDPNDVDFAEGALIALSDQDLQLATPYSGTLTIPRDRLRKLIVLGEGRRLVIDPTMHHLGDEVSVAAPILDPPLPEGGSLKRTFDLAELPMRPAFVVMDVVQVLGESNDPTYSDFVRRGELKTYVSVNGERIDNINHHIKTRNDTAERIGIPVPAGLLRVGKNTLTIELTGMANKPNQLDDLGVLQIAVEFAEAPSRSPLPPPASAP
jgi:hypothetical protein